MILKELTSGKKSYTLFYLLSDKDKEKCKKKAEKEILKIKNKDLIDKTNN